MIAIWMLYCLLWSTWLSMIAALAERLLLRGRYAVRVVWSLAIALSIFVPVTVSFRHPRYSRPVAAAASIEGYVSHSAWAPFVGQPSAVKSTRVPTRQSPSRWVIGNGILIVLWLMLSAATLAYLAVGLARLRRVRSAWLPTTVRGQAVMMSRDVGPAVVGWLRTAIVLPKWALSIDARELDLMLRHEAEHQVAHDAQLLAIAQLVVACIPWNLALWWQLRRLRVGVELDCDARVLRAVPDVRCYGKLLLDVARTRSTAKFAGAAFADGPIELERRIRTMTRVRSANPRLMAVFSLVALTAAITVGCRVPAPAMRSVLPSVDSTIRPTRDAILGLLAEAPPSVGSASRPARWFRRARQNHTSTDTAGGRNTTHIGGARGIESYAHATNRGTGLYGDSRVADHRRSEVQAPDLATFCTARTMVGPLVTVQFVVSDSVAVARDHVTFATEQASGRDSRIEYGPAGEGGGPVICALTGGGELRLSGGSMLDLQPIILRFGREIRVVAMTPAGRRLAEMSLSPLDQKTVSLTWDRYSR
jgi:beta-lactamase regulating signal transducer with metallopeptidase domain